MRASFLEAARTVRVLTTQTPTVRPGDVLVALSAVGVCGSDAHFYNHMQVGDLAVEAPLILGHEAAGVIVATGEGVDPARAGERVAIDPQRPCRRCHACMTGRYNHCPEMEFASAPPIHGAFAEYIAVPADFAFAIPDSISDEGAALLEPLSVGIAAVRKAEITAGSSVLVSGAGPIGVLSAAAARAFGATHVVVSDPMPTRRSIALAHGATLAIDPADGDIGRNYDAYIDASGAPGAITAGLEALRPGGYAVLVGMGSRNIDLDLFTLQSRELHVTGLFRYTDTWPTAIKLVSTDRVQLDSLVTEVFGLDEVGLALERIGDPDVMKLIIDPRR